MSTLDRYQIFTCVLLSSCCDDIRNLVDTFDNKIFPILDKYNLVVDKSRYTSRVLPVIKRQFSDKSGFTGGDQFDLEIKLASF
jgi:hypothetical protein